MLRKIAGLSAALLFSTSMFVNSAEAGGLPKIALVDLEEASGSEIQDAGFRAATNITTLLVKSKGWQVFSRDQMTSIMTEQGFQNASGAVDMSQATQMGQIAGVDYILIGRVTEAAVYNQVSTSSFTDGSSSTAVVEVSLQLIDVKTGGIEAAVDGRGEAKSSSGSFLGVGGGTIKEEGQLLSEAFKNAAFWVAYKLANETGNGNPPDCETKDCFKMVKAYDKEQAKLEKMRSR